MAHVLFATNRTPKPIIGITPSPLKSFGFVQSITNFGIGFRKWRLSGMIATLRIDLAGSGCRQEPRKAPGRYKAGHPFFEHPGASWSVFQHRRKTNRIAGITYFVRLLPVGVSWALFTVEGSFCLLFRAGRLTRRMHPGICRRRLR